MNKDLAGVSAVWRALFGVRGRRFCCFICVLVVYLSSACQRAAENGLAADDGSVSGDGRSSRCCTVGELLRDRDCVSVMVATLVCDEHSVLKIGGAHPHIRKKPRMCGAPGQLRVEPDDPSAVGR